MTETQTEMVPIADRQPDTSITLFGTTDPAALIEKATGIARALAKVINDRELYVKISGRDHVRVEGWTFLGSILGVFPVVVRSDEITKDGSVFGFEAQVEARTRSGEVVGSAVARCTRDEGTWAKRPDFALLSMASTRATSKAMRLPLGWVMTLAGYDATPAEEMPFQEPAPRAPVQHRQDPPREREPGDDDGGTPFDDLPSDGKLLRENVRRAIYDLSRESGGEKEIRNAFAIAKVSGRSFKSLTDAEVARVNDALPAPFRS